MSIRFIGFDSVMGRILPFSYLQAVAINIVLTLRRSMWYLIKMSFDVTCF